MAAAKTAKTRNPERRSGKAWSKAHTSPKTKPAPSAEKVKRREAREPSGVPGFPVTMPDINWEWATNIMAARWPNTRKLRAVDAYLAYRSDKGSKSKTVVDGINVVSS